MKTRPTIESILGQATREADEHLNKVAAAAAAHGMSEDSILVHMTQEEILAVADQVELEGQVSEAAGHIVQMQKQASKETGPSSLDIALEMQKLAHQRAAQNLGLIPKTASEADAGAVLRLLFSGDGSPIDKLAEVAAYFELNRMQK